MGERKVAAAKGADKYRISPDQLLPEARAQYDDLTWALGGKPPALFVNPQANGGKEDLRVSYSKAGTPSITVSEASRRWSEDDARKTMGTDAQIAAYLKPYHQPEVQAQMEAMAKRAGLSTMPTLLALPPESKYDGGVAFTSSEGKMYIALDPKLSVESALAVGAHELGHHVHGDTSAAGVAQHHNGDPAQQNIARETRADSMAAALCQARELAMQLEPLLQLSLDEARVHGVTLPYYLKEHDPEHPPLTNRIADLLKASEREEAAGRCLPAGDVPSAESGQLPSQSVPDVRRGGVSPEGPRR